MHHNNTILGAASGVIGGITKYIISIQFHTEFFRNLIEAGGTALVCGFLGVVGKECYVWIKNAILQFKHKKK